MKILKRHLLLIFLLVVLFSNCSSKLKSNKLLVYNDNFRIDTIQGYFFYEVNVPEKCFTRFDQIEQGNNLIYFDSSIKKEKIENLYQKGVFIFQYQPIIDQYINDHKQGIAQNKVAIKVFNDSVSYFINQGNTVYQRTLYYDHSQILSYKKVHAKFAYINLGTIKQLVPSTKNYKCCYSNTTEMIKTFFIVDVIDFQLY